jgi:hypothetical protein
MSEQTAPEPTMEEILASIRRIISEDDAPGATASAEPADDWEAPAQAETAHAEPDAKGAQEAQDDVLELTERAPTPAETHGDVDVYSAEVKAEIDPPATGEEVHAAAAQPEAVAQAAAEPAGDALVGGTAAASAASAFDRLSASFDKPAGAIASMGMPAAGRTLEDLTRELLRPLLKTWLDENLPGIVQARVDEEVERISRGRVR